MFPITDPSRTDDIRMRRRRAAWLLVGIVAVPLILFSGRDRSEATQHAAATAAHGSGLNIDMGSLIIHGGSIPGTEIQSVLSRIPFVRRLNWTVYGAPLPAGRRDGAALSGNGTSLTVALPCAGSITLVPQTDLSDRVFVSTADGQASGTDGLQLTGSPGLTLGGSCRNGRPDLVIQAPAAMPLTLVQAGDADLRMGSFTGPVRLTQDGSGDAVIDASGPLEVEKSGNGDLSMGHLNGNLHLAQTGSGDTTIHDAQAASVDASMRGSGDFTIPGGHIDHLDAVLRGSGDLSIDAEIGSAAVQSGANNDVKLPHVLGHLDRSTAGETDE